jgi:hypothetical protein
VDVVNKPLAVLIAAALVGGAALTILASAEAATSQSVSLRVVRAQDKNTGLWRVAFSGVVSSGAEGQDVTVLQQTCGASFATAIAGTQTRAGGLWNAEPVSIAAVAASATYRAKWGDVQSEPVAVHPPMPIFMVPTTQRNRMRVMVQTGSVQQDMKGRIVQFERLRNRKWTTIGRKKLVVGLAGGAGFSYEAVFPVKRGWTVRGSIPAASAGPCFAGNATKKAKI